MTIEITLDLPFPPSVNRTRRMDGRGARLLKAWHRQADLRLIGKRLPFRKIKGWFEAHIVLSECSKLDLDNAVKAALDYAVRIELVPDDSPKHLRRIVVEFGPSEGCQITLRELRGGA